MSQLGSLNPCCKKALDTTILLVLGVGISSPFAKDGLRGKKVVCNQFLDLVFVDRGSFEHLGVRGCHTGKQEGFLGAEMRE
jgi:hypothetical protein